MDVAPVLCSTDTRLLLTDRYETTYGICNHDQADPTRPLLLIAMHPAEDTCTGSVLYERLEQFADLCITKHFGLSLTEFLELPTDVCSEIMRIAAKRQKLENTVASDMLDKLERR